MSTETQKEIKWKKEIDFCCLYSTNHKRSVWVKTVPVIPNHCWTGVWHRLSVKCLQIIWTLASYYDCMTSSELDTKYQTKCWHQQSGGCHFCSNFKQVLNITWTLFWTILFSFLKLFYFHFFVHLVKYFVDLMSFYTFRCGLGFQIPYGITVFVNTMVYMRVNDVHTHVHTLTHTLDYNRNHVGLQTTEKEKRIWIIKHTFL